ncbi:MAG: hypothetical protein H7Z40_18920 [Phycisphaerae bacterium]|nr:hypothetical protein [Gemmatimonadaceae bacterium]
MSGITAVVVDASTNRAPLAVPIFRIEDGAYVEEHATPAPRSDPPNYVSAIERPGTYRLIVRAAGYQDYVLDNVRVTRGGPCHYLSGVRLTIPLARTM